MRDKETAVIKYLIENKERELNIRVLSMALKMDYKNVYSIVKRLEKEQLIKLESFGQSNRVRLVSRIHPLIFKAEYERREDFLKDKNFAVMLVNFMKSLKSKFYVLLLFGSYAKKTQMGNSDIDLMFICPDGSEELFERGVQRISESMPLPLHPLVFSEKQFVDMVDAKGLNVVKEALRVNVVLYGIEFYYGLM
ncbi:MAG TPA: nucleotidyltransferase domain-containing protein [Candidatus Nanoarchaeia archaeon]|nr:nucleotidyltransferase domain-containing protein [Candidatus Nanoarchaeia archaeon]